MYPLLEQIQGPYRTSLSYYSSLLDYCLSVKSLGFFKKVHAHFIKLGLNTRTFLGNRCLDIYSEFGVVEDALKVFHDISCKNSISHNICLKGLLRSGQLEKATHLFDGIPMRDVVSWNSIISGFASYGFVDQALGLFFEMRKSGVRPSGFTFSILTSLVSCASHCKQIHGSMIRSGMYFSNVVLGNSLINMYGKLGLPHYAFGVILTIKELDVISWNSLILGCHRAGNQELALAHFYRMRATEHVPDEYTISIVIHVLSDLKDLEKGKQVFGFCFKMGFVSNSIISSATIDMFSKCNRLEDSVQFFNEQDKRDLALCNSMISSYVWYGLTEDALGLFVLILRRSLMPNEFTLSCVLSSISIFSPTELVSQIHSLVVKLGFESDAIVASTLIQIYAKFGLINHAVNIFTGMGVRDIISWNTIMMGLVHNGRGYETMDCFKDFIGEGLLPDRITLAAVLLACNYGNFVDEAMRIFSLMEKEYGVAPGEEHCACIVELLIQAGKVREAMSIVESMPCPSSSVIWKSILCASAIHGDLRLTEVVAEKIMEIEPEESLPFLVLAQIYETRGRWESMVRIRRALKHKPLKMTTGCSWIGIKDHVYNFEGNQLQHHGGEGIYQLLDVLNWEIENGSHI